MSTTFRFDLKTLALSIGLIVLLLAHWIFAASLKSPPTGVEPVENVDLPSMKGHWFEIARMPNDLETGFGQAALTIKTDEENAVILTLTDRKNSQQSREMAADYDEENPSRVLISCVLWLKCGYHVVALDSRRYEWFVVVGHNFDHVWLFARKSGIDQGLLKQILANIAELGFDRDRLEIHNEPLRVIEAPKLNQPIKPKNPLDDPYAILPQEPANLPPVPSQIPEVPREIPAIPKEIPAIPREMPTPNWNPTPIP